MIMINEKLTVRTPLALRYVHTRTTGAAIELNFHATLLVARIALGSSLFEQ